MIIKTIAMKTFVLNKISGLVKGFCVSSFLIISLPGSSQLQSKADLSITSITIADDIITRGGGTINAKTTFANLKCTITVHNETGNTVNQVMLAVILPPDITIVSNTNVTTEYRSGTGNRGGWLGSLVFEHLMMSDGQDLVIEFIFTRSLTHTNTIGTYVFSGSPDPDPSNNSKSATY